MTPSSDRPPVLRFLILFAALLAIALALAALSPPAEPLKTGAESSDGRGAGVAEDKASRR